MMKSRAPLTILAALLLLLSGCAYHMVGSGSGEPVGVRLSRFDDQSREPLFGPRVLRELARRGLERTDVAVGAEGGYGMELRLLELTESPRAFNRTNVPSEYLLVAKADTYLVKGGQTVWKNLEATARRSFPAGGDIATTNSNRERAMLALADELATEVLRRASVAARGLEGKGADGGAVSR